MRILLACTDRLANAWTRRFIVVGFVTVFGTTASLAIGQEQDIADGSFLAELKQRQLYRLAELHCRQQLERGDLTGTERATFAEELLINMAKRAIASPAEKRTQLWARIDETADELQSQSADLVRTQVLATHQSIRISHARSLLLSALSSRDPQRLKEEARILFRTAVRELKSLDTQLAESYRTTSNAKDKQKLRSLRLKSRYSSAEASLYSAELFEAQSPDHVRALSQAADAFSELSRAKPASRLTFISRLNEVKAYRLMKQFDQALGRLNELDLTSGDPTLILLAQNELSAIRIDSGAVLEGVERLAKAAQNSSSADPSAIAQARYTLVRGYAQLTRDSKDASAQKTWQSLAVDQLKQLEQNHDAAWVRRAEALLTVSSGGQESSDLELMKRTAANSYRREEFEQAVVGYERAAALANELGLGDEAFDLRFKAAAISHTTRDYQRSFDAFERLATSQPDHPQAADAHWLAVQAAASLVRQSIDELSRYESVLQSHVDTWPQAETANQARIWLARLRRKDQQYDSAIELLSQVTSRYERFSTVLDELSTTYYAWLEASTEPERVGRIATEHFAQLLSDSSIIAPQSPQARRQLTCQTALNVVQFGYLFTDASVGLFKNTIEANGLATDCKSLDKDTYAAMRGLAGALSDDIDSALNAWRQIDWSPQPWIIPMVARLDKRIATLESNGSDSKQLATLQRHLIEAIQTHASYADSAELRGFAARALIRSGQTERAIEELSKLASDRPNDAALQMELARAWELQGDKTSLTEALACWRRVARLSREQSPQWFEGKLGIARCLIEVGEVKRGADSIKLMQALHPQLGGPKYRREFLKLLEKSRIK